MLKPITPFVEYALNYSYIAKVLCINKDVPEMECNGKCYLMKKLENQQEEDRKALRVSMEEYPVGFVILLQIKEHSSFLFQTKEKHLTPKNYSFLYTSSVFHPPTV
ncbi:MULTISPECIES: hypothetical protein [Tenacibaculum]|uniref:hypothetical protein n=1 Tax=Tenacibaculum TaxID=104267 RepID=UPI001F0AFCAD|nr:MULTISPECIES: hypothetical protein [Tenacibaculum]MCH3881246.1 hypothetical protein [Tenacibaculum aquimarinum]MDO6599160.1 hypothetical protein [Tenacibaculum sp. 1_MG-2023]